MTAAGEARRLTLAALDAEYPTWTPDNRDILFSAKGGLWRLTVASDSTPAQLPFASEDALMTVVSSPQPGRPARLVYVRSFQDRNIWRVETTAPGAVALALPVLSIASTRGDGAPELSPTRETLDFVHNVHNTGVMSMAYVSGRVPVRTERLMARQARAARTSKSNLVARYIIEKSLETEFPGISFRDSLSGREAYLTGHRVAVWEVLAVYQETKSIAKTVRHFRWPRVLVTRALSYARAFPEEIAGSREGETATPSVTG